MYFDIPVSFYFKVKLVTLNPMINMLKEDTSFMEVSGINAQLNTEILNEGGNLNYPYHLPNTIKYDNLQLKRGITTLNSNFAVWCLKNLNDNLSGTVSTGCLMVSLLGSDSLPLRAWIFDNAYPVKWNVAPFDSKKNDLAIETIEISYSYFTRVL